MVFYKPCLSFIPYYLTCWWSESSPVLCPVPVEAVLGVYAKVSPPLDDCPTAARALHVAKHPLVLTAHRRPVDASPILTLLQNVVTGSN